MKTTTKKETAKEKAARLQMEASMKLDVALTEGWTAGDFSFNEAKSYKFCTLMNTALNLGLAGIVWLKDDGTVAQIPIDTAKQMAGAMMLKIKEIHGIK